MLRNLSAACSTYHSEVAAVLYANNTKAVGLCQLHSFQDRKVARLYGMIHPQHDELYTVRTVFVIDPRKKIRLTFTYPQTAGRNFDEVLRVIDSLQLTDSYSVSTPVNWNAGQDVIIVPAVSDADAARRFPRGWREAKSYLRLTPDPRLSSSEIDFDATG